MPSTGSAGRQDRAFDRRAGIVVNAVRPARDDDAAGGPQFLERYVARENFGRNAEFPDLASDQVAVLTAGIEYGDL